MNVDSVLVGDCMDWLPRIPAGRVQSICSSPPYWNLRSYLEDGHEDKAKEFGTEKLHDCGIATSSYLELRDDLTTEEKQYVIKELRRLGII